MFLQLVTLFFHLELYGRFDKKNPKKDSFMKALTKFMKEAADNINQPLVKTLEGNLTLILYIKVLTVWGKEKEFIDNLWTGKDELLVFVEICKKKK